MTQPAKPRDMAQVEFYEERAAIMEYDGKIPREEAERLAWKETVERLQKTKQGQQGETKQKQFFG